MRFLSKFLGSEGEQRAPQPPSPSSSTAEPAKFKVGWATDVGKARGHNEDTALIIMAGQDGNDSSSSAFGLFVLADGMGGHRAGEVASSLAARVVAHHIMQQSFLPTLVREEHDAGEPALNEVLVEAVQRANVAVARQVPGGGTTLTGALVLDRQAYVAHVGDSRAYVASEGGLTQITHDHSLVDRLVESGQLTAEEAAIHPQKNVLYRAVGQSSVLKVDTYVQTLNEQGYLLLCSDGLWDMVEEVEIFDIIMNASSLQGACDDLIAAANEAGGRDNVTAILLKPPLC